MLSVTHRQARRRPATSAAALSRATYSRAASASSSASRTGAGARASNAHRVPHSRDAFKKHEYSSLCSREEKSFALSKRRFRFDSTFRRKSRSKELFVARMRAQEIAETTTTNRTRRIYQVGAFALPRRREQADRLRRYRYLKQRRETILFFSIIDLLERRGTRRDRRAIRLIKRDDRERRVAYRRSLLIAPI